MHSVRIAAFAVIVTFFSAAGAFAKPVTLAADTNLRKSPGTDGEVLTLMPKGTTVEVGKCTNGWCQTTSDGKDGYAIAQNLGMAPRRGPRPPPIEDEIDEDDPPVAYGPPPYVVGPPVYYGYRPYGYYGGWGYRGWGRRW